MTRPPIALELQKIFLQRMQPSGAENPQVYHVLGADMAARTCAHVSLLRACWPIADAKGNVFFLHIPRTAGRTYYFCFLKLATPPSRRCEKSYDVLRLNSSLADCGLLGSHDDLSVLRFLPHDTAVVTQLR